MIAGLTEKFSQKHAYAFRKIITVRKPKLRYNHLGIDEAVLLGMQNDLNGYFTEVVSKQSQIFRQSQLLRSMADAHAKAFFGFFDAFYTQFQTFDGAGLENRLLSDDPDLHFTAEESQHIGRIWHLARVYAQILPEPVVIGEPFFDIESRVLQSVKTVRKAPSKTIARELLKMVVQMKLGAYRILIRQLDDAMETGRFVSMSSSTALRIDQLIDLFESLQFLKTVKLGKKLDTEFSAKLAHLRHIRECMSQDPAKLRSYLSEILAK